MYFLDKIDTLYTSYSVSDNDLKVPSKRKVGKGGVAILIHKQIENRITLLPINSDRIIGVQCEISCNFPLAEASGIYCEGFKFLPWCYMNDAGQ